MSGVPTPLTPELHRWLLDATLREPDALRRLREETAALPESNMQIAPEEGQFLAFLVRLLGARRVLEAGTFTGYSALAMALALPPGGRLVACDVSETWTAVARRHWQDAGVADRVDLRLGPALATMDALAADGAAGTFDLVFVDADKESSPAYVNAALVLLRAGGVLAIDNLFWDGLVARSDARDPETEGIRQAAGLLRDDPRVDLAAVPLADGLLLARKR